MEKNKRILPDKQSCRDNAYKTVKTGIGIVKIVSSVFGLIIAGLIIFSFVRIGTSVSSAWTDFWNSLS